MPRPYKSKYVSYEAIEASLPDAIGAFVEWLVQKSGWTVSERAAAAARPRVPIQARHVAILFRRFTSWGDDVTRPYVEALEARQVPHLLVGGRSFHEREEVDALQRGALRHRVARRRVVGLRDAARRVLRVSRTISCWSIATRTAVG